MYIHLTQEAKDLCKTNYNSNCGTCPLRPACTRTGSSHLTLDKLNAETIAINELAKKIIKGDEE